MSSTSLLLSLRATDATRVTRLSAIPQDILDIVDALHGATTMESKLAEPDARGENMSEFEK